ncbi:MAG: cofactor-independent phosphoglycerate mutase [Candidatus Altiarchaeota archaeon]
MDRKIIILIGDGMGDYPSKELDGLTPLASANTPYMDEVAKLGTCGTLKTLGDGMPLGSDIACMNLLGYDPIKYYPGGRGPFEAEALGLEMDEGDLIFRANLVCSSDSKMMDHSAGHITTEEAEELIKAVESELGTSEISFHPGVSYRHICRITDSEIQPEELTCTPPHDILRRELSEYWIKGKTDKAKSLSQKLNRLMEKSQEVLESHPINRKRMMDGLPSANMIWLWGQGKKPVLPSFAEKYGLKGSMISAVDLVKGMASLVGLKAIHVEGATGYLDTNFKGKVEAALDSLKKKDFVYVHVEAPDEASHEGSLKKKIEAIELFDKKIVRPILSGLRKEGYIFNLAVLCDHYTPISVRTHTSDPVPFAVYKSDQKGDEVKAFSEKDASNGGFGERAGLEFMKLLLK